MIRTAPHIFLNILLYPSCDPIFNLQYIQIDNNSHLRRLSNLNQCHRYIHHRSRTFLLGNPVVELFLHKLFIKALLSHSNQISVANLESYLMDIYKYCMNMDQC